MQPWGTKGWCVLLLGISTILKSSIGPQDIFGPEYTYCRSKGGKFRDGLRLKWPSLNTYDNKGGYAAELLRDVVYLNANIFTSDSFKIIAMTFPPFIVSRAFDCKLQDCFYCHTHHKNINQISDNCEMLSKYSISLPIVMLGSLAFIADNPDLQMTSYVYLLGLPFVIFGKDILKKLKMEECKRPWNEMFCKYKRSYGGFPSGHMAQATYTAVLYGKRFGPYFALPLAAVAGYLGASFLSCNRHYLSQLVAGATLGTLYAYAADKLIERKLDNAGVTIRFSLKANRPCAQISCRF
jgi:hypothetical protein